MSEPKITIAVPKGRILKQLLPLMKQVNIIAEDDFFSDKSRKLIFATNHEHIELIRVRSFDAAAFIAFGAAQIGVVGSDVLDEFDYSEIYAPLDLNIGQCRLSVAQPVGLPKMEELSNLSHIRISTKYPNLTRRYFASLGIQAECIKLNGAMELAPKVGLSERIVDLVETGSTLKANGLEEVSTILNVSSRLCVNRSAWKTRPKQIGQLVEAFKEIMDGA
ncbi:MAG: ATP phosphoribosyltransferase [Alphaproteobacteria bacterium]